MTYIERVNTLPQFNVGCAFDIGLKVPDILYLDKTPGPIDLAEWVIIPTTQIAVRRIDGIHITTTGWWTGDRLTNPVVSIHDKALLTGAQGGELEDNCITMFQEKPSPVMPQMNRLCKIIQAKQSEYSGIVSIDAVVDGSSVYYYDIRFGVSYDLALCYAKFFNTTFDMAPEHLNETRRKASRYCMTQRVYAYPYNDDHNLQLPEVIFNPKHITKGPESYIAFNWHSMIEKGWKQLRNTLMGTELSGACFRVDGDVKARRVYFKMKRAGMV
jgi:hypothetical protein